MKISAITCSLKVTKALELQQMYRKLFFCFGSKARGSDAFGISHHFAKNLTSGGRTPRGQQTKPMGAKYPPSHSFFNVLVKWCEMQSVLRAAK